MMDAEHLSYAICDNIQKGRWQMAFRLGIVSRSVIDRGILGIYSGMTHREPVGNKSVLKSVIGWSAVACEY
jgi:hypothetical protein